MILTELRSYIEKATTDVLERNKKETAIPVFDLSIPPSKIPGDLAANVVLMIAKKIGVPPPKLAREITSAFHDNSLIKKVDVAGPGFLNFWLTDEAYHQELEALLSGGKYAVDNPLADKKILLEYVSANPTGPLHIGHGRGAALGDSLLRIFRYLNWNIQAEFYVNDAGGQIRNLGLSVEARIRELKGDSIQFPENGYKGSYVIDIAKEALESGRSFTPIKSDQIIFSENDLAGFASVRLLKKIKSDLNDFEVHFDNWYGETNLHKKGSVPDLFKRLKEKDLAYEKDNALWFRATSYGDEKDRVLQKANDAPTYFASDIAYHEDKFARGYNALINIWGADHHGYAQRLLGALTALGHISADIKILFNQMVSIKGGRLSKRAGDIVSLKELVDEVGKDATRFFFALRSPGAHFEFDLDLAKKQASDNPVFYVQYVHARCCSIIEEAKKRSMLLPRFHWKNLKVPPTVDPAEKSVLMHLMNFDATVSLCARDFSNHHLTVYLMELAGKYHAFYEKCHVLLEDESVRSFRLDLIDAIRMRVAQGLDLLGVSAPEKL